LMIRVAPRRAKHSDLTLFASARSEYGTTLQYCGCG
jgi:hypothetical protein